MTQLGFTFYPKDWWTSDTFFTLNAEERYIYLELLFMMYVNDGYIVNQKTQIEKRLITQIKTETWENVIGLFIQDGDKLTHKSVNKRLNKAIANRENGKKGGRPKGTVKNPNNHENNPPYKENRNININEKEKETNSVIISPELQERISLSVENDINETFQIISKDIAWMEIVAMNNGLKSTNAVKNHMNEFFKYQTSQGVKTKSINDAKSHFANWLRLELKKIKV